MTCISRCVIALCLQTAMARDELLPFDFSRLDRKDATEGRSCHRFERPVRTCLPTSQGSYRGRFEGCG